MIQYNRLGYLFNWFSGVSGIGGYGIINEKDLIGFNDQILYYITAINYHLNENKNRMIINDQRIGLHKKNIIKHILMPKIIGVLLETFESNVE